MTGWGMSEYRGMADRAASPWHHEPAASVVKVVKIGCCKFGKGHNTLILIIKFA